MSSSHRPYLNMDFHEAVRSERAYQDDKWGAYNSKGHSAPEWLSILLAELGEVSEEVKGIIWDLNDPMSPERRQEQLRAELIQVAAVAAAWLEDIDARGVRP